MSKSSKLVGPDPIKGYSHKGFVAGWCAIMLVGITGFGLLTLPLDYSSADFGAATADPAITSIN